jgi:hypothetical protein
LRFFIIGGFVEKLATIAILAVVVLGEVVAGFGLVVVIETLPVSDFGFIVGKSALS